VSGRFADPARRNRARLRDGGRLGVKIGFESFELGPGDAITFDARMPHRLWTIGDEPAAAVWVVLNRHGDTRSAPAEPARTS
jgi:hypothetical protein